MDRERALHVAVTAIVREILSREVDGEYVKVPPGPPYGPQPPADDPNPHPQFDFDESTCEHGGLIIDRSVCPIHGPESMGPPPTAEELDDLTGETFDEANPLIARAERLRKQREKREATQRQFAEDLPLAGMGPPPDDLPPLVV